MICSISEDMPDVCPKREELRAAATELLELMGRLCSEQSKAIRENDHTRLAALDRKFEEAFGQKERAYGALEEHRKEHGC